MSATYNPRLTATLDWVRFLTGDTDVNDPSLSDEEILAVIADVEQGNKYLAAARCGELIVAASGGVVSKQVGDLKIQYGDGNEGTAYRNHLSGLQKKGALQVGPRARYFEAL